MKETIIKLLKKATNEKNILLEVPPNPELGDYAFPCFFLTKKFKKNPNEIAKELKEKLGKPKGIKEIKTVGSYLNFFVDRNALALNLINEVLRKKNNFGKINLGKGKKVLIEHTSINPNASPHVGRVRNALIGDSIVKLHKFLGFKPEVHYYVNDVSKQIAMLVLAKAEKLGFEAMLKKYIEISKKVSSSKILEQKVFQILNALEKKDKKTKASFKKITDTCVKGQAKILAELGIRYDYFDYESSYLNKTKKIIHKLQKTQKLFKDKEGRFVLNQEGTSVEGKMKFPVLVLTRKDGTGLYPLRDLAYTIDKLKKSNKNIIVLGEDQKLYLQQLSEALKILGFKSPDVVHYSFILLSEQNKLKKMSTRKGNFVLLEDFLNEATQKAKLEIQKRKTSGDAKKVAISAVKYAILKITPNRAISFNLEESLKFEGDTGPYLLYSYARASSIIRKAKIKKGNLIIFGMEQKELELVKKLSQFPDIVLSAYKNLNPSLIANYSYQLAQIFNEFYHCCPVIGSKSQTFRLKLVQAFRQVLKNSLSLLGIDVLERM